MLHDSFGHFTNHRLSIQFADENNKKMQFIWNILIIRTGSARLFQVYTKSASTGRYVNMKLIIA